MASVLSSGKAPSRLLLGSRDLPLAVAVRGLAVPWDTVPPLLKWLSWQERKAGNVKFRGEIGEEKLIPSFVILAHFEIKCFLGLSSYL